MGPVVNSAPSKAVHRFKTPDQKSSRARDVAMMSCFQGMHESIFPTELANLHTCLCGLHCPVPVLLVIDPDYIAGVMHNILHLIDRIRGTTDSMLG